MPSSGRCTGPLSRTLGRVLGEAVMNSIGITEALKRRMRTASGLVVTNQRHCPECGRFMEDVEEGWICMNHYRYVWVERKDESTIP